MLIFFGDKSQFKLAKHVFMEQHIFCYFLLHAAHSKFKFFAFIFLVCDFHQKSSECSWALIAERIIYHVEIKMKSDACTLALMLIKFMLQENDFKSIMLQVLWSVKIKTPSHKAMYYSISQYIYIPMRIYMSHALVFSDELTSFRLRNSRWVKYIACALPIAGS